MTHLRSIGRFAVSALVVTGALGAWFTAAAQRAGVFDGSIKDPAIAYLTGPVSNVVDDLDKRLTPGQLTYEPGAGYLRSVLEALDVAVDSQVLVFSQTSAQADHINMRNPRAVFFNERVAIGWVRGADVLELAAQDARQGTIFYTLEQRAEQPPRFRRDDTCLRCHLTWDTLGVPGPMVLTTFPMSDDKNSYARGFVTDHRSPYEQRWGGWFVTGQTPGPHMGNIPVIFPEGSARAPSAPPMQSVEGRFDLHGYLSPHSDVAALLVLEHQTRMANAITRIGWEARAAAGAQHQAPGPVAPGARAEEQPRVREAAEDLVDYLLFVDEEPLPQPVKGSSGFTARFSAKGPRDSANRSLYELDLKQRLLRFRCSYMIYSPPFEALPAAAAAAVYSRLWDVLSGKVSGSPYTGLTRDERRAIVEILRDTKPGLPAYFRPL